MAQLGWYYERINRNDRGPGQERLYPRKERPRSGKMVRLTIVGAVIMLHEFKTAKSTFWILVKS